METKVLTAHVSVELAEKIDELATRLGRSKGWIVKQALTAWIGDEEERHRLTLKVLASVDVGRLVGHERVRGRKASERISPCRFRVLNDEN